MNIVEAHAAVVQKLGINIPNLRSHRNFLNDNIDVVQQHFRMSQFCLLSMDDLPEDEVAYIKKAGLDIDCGSQMCVVGWAPTNPELAKQISPDHGGDDWRAVTELFINHDEEVHLFTYLFGQDWADDVDLAVKRMDYVIEAAETANEHNLRFLCAAANNELGFDEEETDLGYHPQDRHSAHINGLYDYPLEDWVESVMENEFIVEL